MPRPKLSEEEKKERRREANKKYNYETHKQSMQAKARARYHQSKRGDDPSGRRVVSDGTEWEKAGLAIERKGKARSRKILGSVFTLPGQHLLDM